MSRGATAVLRIPTATAIFTHLKGHRHDHPQSACSPAPDPAGHPNRQHARECLRWRRPRTRTGAGPSHHAGTCTRTCTSASASPSSGAHTCACSGTSARSRSRSRSRSRASSCSCSCSGSCSGSNARAGTCTCACSCSRAGQRQLRHAEGADARRPGRLRWQLCRQGLREQRQRAGRRHPPALGGRTDLHAERGTLRCQRRDRHRGQGLPEH